MPRITYDAYAFWSNYHMTVSFPARPQPDPGGSSTPTRVPPLVGIQQLGHIYAADLEGSPPLVRFARLARILQRHVADTAAIVPESPDLAGPPPAGARFAAGMVGRGWSFSPLVGTPVSQLLCDGLAHVGLLAEEHRDATIAKVPIALVGGGTRLREIADWAAPHGLTIATSGTHLGPTIAGAIGTGSHGSKLGYGGIQNMVVGLHIVTGPAEHVWLERASRPVLNGSGLLQLAIDGSAPTPLRDDDLFEAALVHLGGMGIINGVAIELVEDIPYGWFRRNHAICGSDLQLLDRGDFRGVADRLGCDAAPAFYELTIDPHAPFGADAYHTMFFALNSAPDLIASDADILGASEAMVRYARRFAVDAMQWSPQVQEAGPTMQEASIALLPGPDRTEGASDSQDAVIRKLFGGVGSAFGFYGATGGFDSSNMPCEPIDLPHAKWTGLHARDEITGGVPGALYNASFAIPRNQLSRAVPAICEAVRTLSPTFIFTVRFVSSAAGTLAFTRFPESAVIEIDGLSPFIFDHLAASLDPADPASPIVREAMGRLAIVLPEGASRVREALDAAGVPFSMHWAKLGGLDAAKVRGDFGDPVSEPGSLLGRWRAARSFLLDPGARALFWNRALVDYGIVR